jgi:iron complex transport system substrate-binding protein
MGFLFLAPGARQFLTRRRRQLATLLVSAFAVACAHDSRVVQKHEQATSASARDSAIEMVDDEGRRVRLERPATRIISLIPSATETLIALGAAKSIVGKTRYDVASEVAQLPSVGGGIDPSVEAIIGLHPDLVLAWDNDKRQEVPNKLISLGVPVFTLRTEDTSDVFRAITNVGRLTGRDSAARALSASIHAQLEEVRKSVAGRRAPNVLYVVYNDPPMTAGPATFIGQLISLAGGHSIFSDTKQLWPTASMEEIVRRKPDLLIVPAGEFKVNSIDRFRDSPGWRDMPAVKQGRMVSVSADLMSRPGPNIAKAARVLRASFFPEFASQVDSVTSVARKVGP